MYFLKLPFKSDAFVGVCIGNSMIITQLEHLKSTRFYILIRSSRQLFNCIVSLLGESLMLMVEKTRGVICQQMENGILTR